VSTTKSSNGKLERKENQKRRQKIAARRLKNRFTKIGDWQKKPKTQEKEGTFQTPRGKTPPTENYLRSCRCGEMVQRTPMGGEPRPRGKRATFCPLEREKKKIAPAEKTRTEKGGMSPKRHNNVETGSTGKQLNAPLQP